MGVFDLAITNLLSPMVLFFALGLAAALSRSDLNIPEAVAKGMSIYLMLAIGFKGGAGVAAHGIDAKLLLALLAGIVLSAIIPIIAFQILTRVSNLPRVDAAAVAAHYGSISIVTFLAGTEALKASGIKAESFMVAVAAAMETPAIFAGLILAQSTASAARARPASVGAAGNPNSGLGLDRSALREVALNGSIVVLVGSFIIGWVTGDSGLKSIEPFIVSPFKGVLCLFLLDMGLIAGRGLRDGAKNLSFPVIAFGIYMPLIGAALGLIAGMAIGLSAGGTALLITLSASASYIAVPAAMRLALPEARPAIYLPLSLGVTFPFNLVVGLPIYIFMATSFVG